MTLREQLFELAEPAYREFSMPLMPGVEEVIGVRIPQLRGIAREIVRGDWRAYLAQAETRYFEERLLKGLVIGYARCEIEEKLGYVAQFVPLIDNWAVCDCFCWRLKAREREAMWHFIQPYFRSAAEYDIRFAVVMALGNFTDAGHVGQLLERLDNIRHEGYYARMGIAWAVSVCFVKAPDTTRAWLEGCRLDDWTYNKSLQKITESLRVDDSAKAEVRRMKRPTK